MQFLNAKIRIKNPTFDCTYCQNWGAIGSGSFFNKGWGQKSYAKHRTSAPCNFYTINFLLFLAYDDLSRYNCEIGPLISFKKMFYNYYQKIKTKLLEIVQLSH